MLWGDVFFCSGQSNMVFPMSLTLNAKEEIATVVNYPNFRLFQVAGDLGFFQGQPSELDVPGIVFRRPNADRPSQDILRRKPNGWSICR